MTKRNGLPIPKADTDDVLIVVDNDYERRYFYSATTATRGLGWFSWPNRHGSTGKLKVYRLDKEASDALTQQILAAPQSADANGRWSQQTKTNFKAIFKSFGIKES